MDPDGHKVFVHAIILSDASRAWRAWEDPAELSKWFTSGARQDFRVGGRYENGDLDSGEFLAIEPPVRIRFTWEQKQHKPGSEVEVRFVAIDGGETEVQIHHERLSDEKEVENLTEGWTWALDSMKSYLETGRPIAFDEWRADRE